jgi:Flp pilus assembly pilin Flp
MMKFVKNFRNDEDGAVTVDWVVLTAAVVGLAIAAYGSISSGAADMTAQTSTFLNSQTIGDASFGGVTVAGSGN